MPELGIEAASDDASVAVLDGDHVLAVRRWHITSTASRELLAAIDAVLRVAGTPRDAVTAVAVDVGPGGYGSLRTSVATAQGLALALDIPLAGVDRLEVAAYPHLAPGVAVVAVHDLGRSGIAWAAFAPCDAAERGAPERLGPTRIDSVEDCFKLAPRGAIWCGDVSPALLGALSAIDGIAAVAHAQQDADGGTDTAAASDDTARGGYALDAVDVVRLARLRRAYGDPASVDVTYLRPPSIGARRALG